MSAVRAPDAASVRFATVAAIRCGALPPDHGLKLLGRGNSLGALRAVRPVALIGAPEADVAVVEGIPPGVEHLAVEAEDAFACYAGGWRCERGEAVIDAGAICIADAGEQMPKRQSVALARVHKNDAKQLAAFCRRVLAKIKSRERVTKGRCGVLEIRRAWADFRARSADRSGGDEGFVAAQLEADPAHGGAQKARAGIIHVQRIHASQIHGDGRRRIHDKLAGWRPDGSANRSALEGEPAMSGAVANQAEARTLVYFDAAGFIERDCGSRGIVRYKSLSNPEFSDAGVSTDGFRTDARCAFEARHIPGRSQFLVKSRRPQEKIHGDRSK